MMSERGCAPSDGPLKWGGGMDSTVLRKQAGTLKETTTNPRAESPSKSFHANSGAGRYVTIQTKTDTLTPYRRWTNRLISPVIESLSGCTSSRIKGAGIATTLTRGHETARGPAQQLRT